MRLPQKKAAPSVRRAYGIYVATRLTTADEDASSVQQATETVKLAARALEDIAESVPTALAHRDARDDILDDLAQQVRLALSSRSTTATKEAPYKMVFHKGMGYYLNAPIPENANRYRDLAARLTSALAKGDPVLEFVAPIVESATAYEQAAAATDKARNEVGLARTKLDAAEEDWDRAIEKTYGFLISEYGKAKAERFFPRLSKRDEVVSDDDAPAPTIPPVA